MKVFKTIIAGVVVGALTLAMATSAFAATATVSKDTGVVTPAGFTNATSGNMTVMVVNAEAYDANNITANDICYIDQFSYSEAATKLASLASRNLKYGDYYVVVGSSVGISQKSSIMGTIKVGEVAVEGNTLTWNVRVKPQFMVAGDVTAKLYNTMLGVASDAVTLEWEDGVITGEGDVEFDVVTNLKDAQYVGSVELEIASGVLSDRAETVTE